MYNRCGTLKIPPCSKALSTEHRPKFYSPPPAMVKSQYKWNNLEQDVKPSIINLDLRIKSEEDRRSLQQDLDTLQKCEDQWLMQLHPKKCRVLQITTRTPLQPKYTIHVLNNVNSAKFLGLNIHKTLNWDVHINKVTQKAHNTLSFSSRNIGRWPTNIKARCYSTLVRSSLEYAFTNRSPAKN
jgi:hypothetical protein